MKIDFLEVRSDFKNLNGVRVDFDENSLMTVIVGRNGSGKSNVLEAIVAIFRNLDLGEPPPFSYKIRYRLGTGRSVKWVIIDADPTRPAPSRCLAVTSNDRQVPEEAWKSVSASKLSRSRRGVAAYLPNYLFAYYSGPSGRLEEYFRKHRTDFYRRLLKGQLDLVGEIRPLFYAKPVHSQFVLLAFFLGADSDREHKFLREQLGITGLDSVHFVMRRPDWVRQPEEIFWGAGGVVREFLDKLYPLALAPLRLTRLEDTSLTGRGVKNEFIHLFVPDLQHLRSFASGMTADAFFKMLESTLLSEIISEVRVTVRVEGAQDSLSFRELSEGEQQLLTVLGLLKFTGGKDSLFLLDEPDTHLNPAWAVKYLQFLRDFVPSKDTSHLLMVSHHPLAIAELEKEQVQVMWRDSSNNVRAVEPATSPRGMGYSGILTSDMFGLRTTLDAPTEKLIRDRLALTEKPSLTPAETAELKELDRALEQLGFSSTHWDTDYREYLLLRKEADAELFRKTDDDSPEIQRRRREVAAKIVRDMVSKGELEASREKD